MLLGVGVGGRRDGSVEVVMGGSKWWLGVGVCVWGMVVRDIFEVVFGGVDVIDVLFLLL